MSAEQLGMFDLFDRPAPAAPVAPALPDTRESCPPVAEWFDQVKAHAQATPAPEPPPAKPKAKADAPQPPAPIRDTIGERILAEGLAPNEFLLGLNGVMLPYDRVDMLTGMWALPSRMFRFPIETCEPWRDRDGTEHPRTLGLLHPLLAEHPWVLEVEPRLGMKLDPNGAPNQYGYTKTATGLWWHAVDLMTAEHWRDLLDTRQFTTDEDIAGAVCFALRYGPHDGKRAGKSYITTREARTVLEEIGKPRPTDGSIERAWSTVDLTEFKGEGGKLQRAINWRERDRVAVAYATIDAIERGWFVTTQSGFLKWTDAAKAPQAALL